MGTKDPRVDEYIANAAPFAQPILVKLRAIVHEACPDVEETIKWRMPSFEYKGLLCGMAAFKQHCTFGFWKHKEVVGDDRAREAMGSFGCIRKPADLPPKRELVGYIKKAMALNDSPVKTPRLLKHPKKPPPAMPDDLAAALKRNKAARTTFEKFPPSHRREYIEWIVEAKREETRAKRLATTLEWLAEGKTRNWKYENC
jgi:uncharacterized protein YdeI (YjbR/CyaY-like superfamily)